VGERLYTIAPSAPFLTTLARAILAGELPVPGGTKPSPLTLPLTTIYLPTRRAARALREAFLAETEKEALLLPRIRALGDPDEEAALILGAGGNAEEDGGAGASAIGGLARRIALMRLVLAWTKRLRTEALIAQDEFLPAQWVATPAQASHLAADLARLMYLIESQ
jgi:ATP-dependent helicase/nuclease subunit B